MAEQAPVLVRRTGLSLRQSADHFRLGVGALWRQNPMKANIILQESCGASCCMDQGLQRWSTSTRSLILKFVAGGADSDIS